MRDQANALTDKFLATIGYPQSADAHTLALNLAKSGVNITGSPFDAYEWLYQNAMTDSQRTANPWAEFGMAKDEYDALASKFNLVMASWTGDTLDPSSMKQAFRESWTPDEIRNFATYGNPEGTGPLLARAQLTGDDPWLGLGQTYTQTLQGFQAFEGQMPTDKATLAAWFRFGVGAKTVRAGEATGQASPKLGAMSEIR